jgi:CspA family cold shock protein
VNPLAGHVVAFNRDVGLGQVVAADGTTYLFHCIEIADGSRDITVGQPVSFSLIGKLGRFEAAQISPA